ncbi:hypothetical protein CEXT_658211 [Caerostris extrusa]|uniref:Uncharacterized protein n=1 Tax=Caerostris extrusa TaxID=172846 RepID=A0AAV4S6I5_CAEEX|nr:hypothetical protein CEXT_658211 [Caerostris extrusa]
MQDTIPVPYHSKSIKSIRIIPTVCWESFSFMSNGSAIFLLLFSGKVNIGAGSVFVNVSLPKESALVFSLNVALFCNCLMQLLAALFLRQKCLAGSLTSARDLIKRSE